MAEETKRRLSWSRFVQITVRSVSVVTGSLTLFAILNRPECISLTNSLEIILRLYDDALNAILTPLENLILAIVDIYDLPTPNKIWKLILVVTMIKHLRALSVDFSFGGSRRYFGILCFGLTLIISTVSAYCYAIFDRSDQAIGASIFIVICVFFTEFQYNAVASATRRNPLASFGKDFWHKQKIYTLGYTASAIVALIAATTVYFLLGVFSIGLYAVFLFTCTAAYLTALDLQSNRQEELRFLSSTRIQVALLLLLSVFGTLGLIFWQGISTGSFLALLVCS